MVELEHSHHPRAIAERLDAAPEAGYLKDFVYGAVDGTVTTFAVVSGVAGAGLSPAIVLVLGIANLLGDGFSMAASNFLGTRAEEQQRQRARRMEARHIDRYPEGEREEVRQIFARKGFRGDDLERAVEVVTSDRERWIDVMLTDELGMSLEGPSPIKAATATFVAFLLLGLVPLVPFLLGWLAPGLAPENPFPWSAGATGLAFFGVGALKGRFVEQHWAISGLETLAIGGAAASLSYVAGALLGGLVG